MLSVGLTGNVAAGKSAVLALLEAHGATVIDTDLLTREVQRPGTRTLQHLAARFGAHILLPDGSLDRSALRRQVMGDPEALAALNAIVHPAVAELHRHRLDAARRRGARIVVSDVPLLFEAGWESQFDLVVLVDAPPEVRRARILAHRGLTPEEVDRLMASQAPAAAKRERSDVVIENDGTRATLVARVRDLWAHLEARARALDA